MGVTGTAKTAKTAKGSQMGEKTFDPAHAFKSVKMIPNGLCPMARMILIANLPGSAYYDRAEFQGSH
jgi:hypothetical protein